jgi:hypothetical protein
MLVIFLFSISIFVRLLLNLIRTLSKFQFNFCSELHHLIRLRLSLWLKVGYSASTLQSQKVGLPFCSNNKTSLGFQSTNPINNDLLLHRFGTFFSFLIVNCTDEGLKLLTFPGLLMSFIHRSTCILSPGGLRGNIASLFHIYISFEKSYHTWIKITTLALFFSF